MDDRILPVDFDRLLPSVSGQSLMVASFALFEQARREPDAARFERVVSFANNYLAYREQHDSVHPAFAPPKVLPGEVSRSLVMRVFTPTLRLDLGENTWTFNDWACRRPDRDRSVFTSHATEYNWATFPDRWPAILDAFQFGYRNAAAVWRMPPVVYA